MNSDEIIDKLNELAAPKVKEAFEKGAYMERLRIIEWAKAKGRGHRELAIKRQDAGDREMASEHISLETAYFGLARELEGEELT